MTELIWEDPPPPETGRNGGRPSSLFTDEIQETLKANDSRWLVLVPEAKMGQVSNASAWVKRNPGFEIRSRTLNKGSDAPYRVYCRYVEANVASDMAKIEEAQAKKAAQPKSSEG